MPRLAVLLAPALLLAACGPSTPADPAREAAQHRANVSQADPRMPTGFTIYRGEVGDVREFQIAPAGDGQIATFSVIGRPDTIRRFYEDQAVAAGMQVIGRVSTGDFMSVDARRAGAGNPHTFSMAAVHKGEYTNVTLMFNVTE
ncbi:MAG: hypothetical protein ABL874_05160 [Sphingopyxis sp.]